jgi:hypothetical protein
MRVWTIGLLMAFCAGSASSQEGGGDIVVEGQLGAAERQVDSLAAAITRRPRIDKPISRQYGPACLGVHGMAPALALALIDRIAANARELGIHVQGEGCQVNTLVSFTRDSRAEVKRLHAQEPWLFSTLHNYEYDRILRGNGAAQAWQATQVKGANGKEFASAVIDGREVQVNKQFSASHLAQQLRVDITGAIVVFDNAFVPGKTIQQLADYATMRLFAPTDDLSNGSDLSMPTILTLFAQSGEAPDGLTDFDRAYLKALYRLPPTAGGAAIRDATWAAYRQMMTRDQAAARGD